MGWAYFCLKDYQQSINSLTDCIQYNSKHARAYIDLGEAYFKIKKDENALKIYEDCLKKNSDVLKTAERK